MGDEEATARFRVDVEMRGEARWVASELRFDSEAGAEEWARDLEERAARHGSELIQGWRVVPETVPERQVVSRTRGER